MTKALKNLLKFFAGRAFCCLLLLCAMLFSYSAEAASGIKSMRIGQGVGTVRIVLDADKKFDYKVFLLNNPKRLVVDTFDINVSKKLEDYNDKNNLVSQTRLGSVGTDGTRIVFDLKKPAIIKKAFMLPPQSTFGWRFVRFFAG